VTFNSRTLSVPVRGFATIVLMAILATPLLFTRRGDVAILAEVGAVASVKIRAALPEISAIAGPLMPIRSIDLIPVDERVRLRLQTEQAIDGQKIQVLRGRTPGEIILRGQASTEKERQTAILLTQSTRGVTAVSSELAVAER